MKAMNALERMLGRRLAVGDRGSIQSFNELPPKLRTEASEVLAKHGPAATARYLRYFVVHSEEYDRFIDEVIRRPDVLLNDWGREDVIGCPRLFEPLLSIKGQNVAAVLGGIDGDRLFRIVPVLGNTISSVSCIGAPGVIVRCAPYWFLSASWQHSIKDQGIVYTNLDGQTVETIDESALEIAVRRWLAGLIAQRLSVESKARTAEAVCAELGGNVISETGRAAVVGLLRSGWPEHKEGVPGFVGPDSFYM